MDAVAADAAAVLVHILFMLTVVVLPINIRSKPLVSLSRLIADKLASSSHLVSLDKHKLSQSPFHRLLLAVVLTNTGYKLIDVCKLRGGNHFVFLQSAVNVHCV